MRNDQWRGQQHRAVASPPVQCGAARDRDHYHLACDGVGTRRLARRDGNVAADVTLPAGRYVYQFVIDEHARIPDPDAPLDPADDFGTRNSVVTVLPGTGLAHGAGRGRSLWIATGLGAAGNNDAYSTARASVGATYADLRARAAWQLPSAGSAAVLSRIGVDLDGGVRGGGLAGRREWIDAAVTVRLIGSSFLVITNGTTAPDPERAIPGTRYTAAGLRVKFGGAHVAASLAPLPNVGSAAPLHQTASGTWATRVSLRPGTHRLNIRVDGGPWRVVDGLPAMRDDLGGEVSVLVVP